MTQEEKAKRYDEALERARNNYGAALEYCEGAQIGVECFKNTLMNIFPELAESEDERIRKELISFLQLPHPQFVGERKQEEWIAWLEKQGDKDKLIKELGEYKVKYTQEVLSQQLEKQAKKKSQRMISAEAKEALYDKSAWSEEDEEMCKNILECLRNGWKKLPTDILKYESWFKSLRPQNTWKPTKEQMYMLEWLTTNVLDDGVVGNKAKEVLNTLIEQLKSL